MPLAALLATALAGHAAGGPASPSLPITETSPTGEQGASAVYTVIAQVTLRTRDGTSILDATAPISAESALRYQVDPEIIANARTQFLALGFSVSAPGPHGFSIAAEPARFEQVFGARLSATDAPAGPAAGAAIRYRAEQPLTIPEHLQHLVAAVSLAQPPSLFP